MSHDQFARLFAALESRSPITIDGNTYAIWLIDIRDPLTGSANEISSGIDAVFGAKGADGKQHIGELHLDRGRLDDLDFIVQHAVSTIEEIVRGHLPRGVRSLL